jgi:hypothetical protein
VRSENGRFDVGALWGWMGSSRETTNTSLIFVKVYMWLQLDSEAKCELSVIQCVNFWVFPRRLVYIGRRVGTLGEGHGEMRVVWTGSGAQ